jgi:ubiquinone/menaquinone biosynthesis C-methylase UbiE
MDNVISEWNIAAESYSEFITTSRDQIFCKEFISNYFNNNQKMKILDAGCGNGVYTDILTKYGNNVIGCDGSSEMLKIAKLKYPFYQFDIVNLLDRIPYSDEEFDIVFCNLVLMDIDPIDNTISEFYRVNKKGGLFFFSILHPAFYLADREKDEKGVIICKRIKNYINPLIIEQQAPWGITAHYHRSLSYYLNKISAVGFSLTKMFEPNDHEQVKRPDIPLFLFIEFKKCK